MSTIELTSKIREIKELQRLIEDATAEMDGIKDQVKAHMEAIKETKMTVDVFKVTYVDVESTRLDSKSLKSELPDIYSRYAKTSTAKRFQIA